MSAATYVCLTSDNKEYRFQADTQDSYGEILERVRQSSGLDIVDIINEIRENEDDEEDIEDVQEEIQEELSSEPNPIPIPVHVSATAPVVLTSTAPVVRLRKGKPATKGPSSITPGLSMSQAKNNKALLVKIFEARQNDLAWGKIEATHGLRGNNGMTAYRCFHYAKRLHAKGQLYVVEQVVEKVIIKSNTPKIVLTAASQIEILRHEAILNEERAQVLI